MAVSPQPVRLRLELGPGRTQRWGWQPEKCHHPYHQHVGAAGWGQGWNWGYGVGTGTWDGDGDVGGGQGHGMGMETWVGDRDMGGEQGHGVEQDHGVGMTWAGAGARSLLAGDGDTTAQAQVTPVRTQLRVVASEPVPTVPEVTPEHQLWSCPGDPRVPPTGDPHKGLQGHRAGDIAMDWPQGQ